MENLLTKSSEVIHDESLFSGVYEIDTVGSTNQEETSNTKQVCKFVAGHDTINIYFNSDDA